MNFFQIKLTKNVSTCQNVHMSTVIKMESSVFVKCKYVFEHDIDDDNDGAKLT